MCHGSRLRPEALTSRLDGMDLAEVSALSLDELQGFVDGFVPKAPDELRRPAETLAREAARLIEPLVRLGLGYLRLDRAGSTLSTGERQRLELTSTVRTNTTGMLYVLDGPSVGLHPSNVGGLVETIHALVDGGNSVVMVEHDVDVIAEADWVIELGPGAGAGGGRVIAQGSPDELRRHPASIIGPFLQYERAVDREKRPVDGPTITLEVDGFNLSDLHVELPVGALTAFAGPSGAGKSALVFDSLVPALTAQLAGEELPHHVRRLEAPGSGSRARRRHDDAARSRTGRPRPPARRSRGTGGSSPAGPSRAPGPPRRPPRARPRPSCYR